jgi:NADPH:quinone reductase-like Zn-dependent oxidoreductase
MKRWILKAGALTLDGLIEQEVSVPRPGPGEVRVRVCAASLNYRDHFVVENAGESWRTDDDVIPVGDAAGIIDAVGDGVTQWIAGDRVVTVYLRDFLNWPPNPAMGLGLGSLSEDGVLAEYIVLSSERVVRAPKNLSFAEASTLPCAALTAWTALQRAWPPQQGQKVLTLGTGSVSLFTVAFAKAQGAVVFATTSRAEKAQKLAALGVTTTFDYNTDVNWGETVFAATGGIDKVVNTAGFGSLNQCVKAAAFGGDIGVVGLMTFGDVIEPGMFLAKGISLQGIPVGSRELQMNMIDFIEQHDIKPVIYKTFEFSEAKLAYKAQLSSDIFGKIVIRLSED